MEAKDAQQDNARLVDKLLLKISNLEIHVFKASVIQYDAYCVSHTIGYWTTSRSDHLKIPLAIFCESKTLEIASG